MVVTGPKQLQHSSSSCPATRTRAIRSVQAAGMGMLLIMLLGAQQLPLWAIPGPCSFGHRQLGCMDI